MGGAPVLDRFESIANQSAVHIITSTFFPPSFLSKMETRLR